MCFATSAKVLHSMMLFGQGVLTSQDVSVFNVSGVYNVNIGSSQRYYCYCIYHNSSVLY